MRHGETDFNKEGKCQGNLDIHLNENGLKQAEKVSKKFILESEPKPNLIISSTLTRAKTTAKSIHKKLEDHHKHKIPFLVTDLLQERGLGMYQGNTFKNMKEDLSKLNFQYEEFPEPRFHYCLNQISIKNENTKIETLEEVNKRVSESIQFILEKTFQHLIEDKDFIVSSKTPYNVIVVSHGLFLCGIIGNLILSEEKWMPVKHSNTGVSSIVLEVEEKNSIYHYKNPSVLHLNDTSHHHFE